MLHLLADEVPVPGSDTAVFVISAPVVQSLISFVIPLITALLTKWTFPAWAKGVITIVLNAVVAALTTAVVADGSAVLSNQTFLTFIYGVVVSVVSYNALWRPAGLTSNVDGKIAPEKGIGRAPAQDDNLLDAA